MKQIGIIGNFGGNGIGGQITKTREIAKAIEQQYGEFNKLDVFEIKSDYLSLIKKMLLIFKDSTNVVIVLASSGYFKILPIVVAINLIYKRNIYELVIGGVRQDYINRKKAKIWMEKKVKKIYVETPYMVEAYKKLGLYNVDYLPNFKDICPISEEEMLCYFNGENQLHVCTFSRIDRLKGVDIAIAIIKQLNEVGVRDVCLDIIGPIDDEYKQDFEGILNGLTDNKIKYLGSVKSEVAVETLKKYDALLFPTQWETEGFPGTFIDAMAAGLPILASKKENFTDIIVDGYNGYLIENNDVKQYMHKLLEWKNAKETLLLAKKNALECAKLYQTSNVLNKIWKEIEGKKEQVQ